MIGIAVVVIAAIVIITAVSTGLFGLVDTKDRDAEFVDRSAEIGFQIERNIIDRRVRTLNGEYQGIPASIVIPRDNEILTTGYSQVESALLWLQLSTNWEAHQVEGALVICEPVPECGELAEALTEAVVSS